MNTRIIYLDNLSMVVVACQKRANDSKKKSACTFKNSKSYDQFKLVLLFLVYVKVFTRIPFPSCDMIDPAMQTLEKCLVPRNSLRLEERKQCKVCKDKDDSFYDDYD